ncbi:armadillo-type protein [Cladochytrium replicatum]|nr:armadillo-type protein [Cladochytrium replicatum]
MPGSDDFDEDAGSHAKEDLDIKSGGEDEVDDSGLDLPWPQFMKEIIFPALAAPSSSASTLGISSVEKRCSALRVFTQKINNQGDFPENHVPPILDLLLASTTHAKCEPCGGDHPKIRMAVLSTMAALVRYIQRGSVEGKSRHPVDNSAVKAAVKVVEKATKGGLAGLSAKTTFGYVTWCIAVINLCLFPSTSSEDSISIDPFEYVNNPTWKQLVALTLDLLDALVVQSVESSPPAAQSDAEGAQGGQRSSTSRHFAVLYARALRLTSNALTSSGVHPVRIRRAKTIVRGKTGESNGLPGDHATEIAADVMMKTILSPSVVDGSDSKAPKACLGIAISVRATSHVPGWIQKYKDTISKFFIKSILGSKTPVPVAYMEAIAPVMSGQQVFDSKVLEGEVLGSTGEKLLLRSPEVVMRVFNYAIASSSLDTSSVFRKFADALLSHMRSTSDAVRQDAVALWKTLCKHSVSDAIVSDVVDVIVKSLAAAKTPEHRQLAYVGLGLVSPGANTSGKVLEAIPNLVAKESSEGALHALLASGLAPHLNHLLSEKVADGKAKLVDSTIGFLCTGAALETPAVVKTISPAARRKAYWLCLQTAIDQSTFVNLSPKSATLVAETANAALEKIQSSLISGGIAVLVDPKKEGVVGYFEAVCALKVLLALRLCKAQSDIADSFVEKKNILKAVLGPHPPKSFLLNDRLYSKLLATPEEQGVFSEVAFQLISDEHLFNLLGSGGVIAPLSSPATPKAPVIPAKGAPKGKPAAAATEKVATVKEADVAGAPNEVARTGPIATALAYLLVSSPFRSIRSDSVSRLKGDIIKGSSLEIAARAFRLFRVAIGAGLIDSASVNAAPAAELSAWNDRPVRCSREFGSRVSMALEAFFPVLTGKDSSEATAYLHNALMEAVVLSCHSTVTAVMGNDTWVRLCFGAGVDPRKLLEERAESAVQKWIERRSGPIEPTDGSLWSDEVPASFLRATLSAIELFTDVHCEAIVPALLPWALGILEDGSLAAGLTATDVAIWKTPEGVLYNDPTKKKPAVVQEARTADEKWEMELRKELEAKRGASAAQAKRPAATPAKGPGKGSSGAATKHEKDQQAERQRELEKEAVVRSRVQKVVVQLSSSMRALQSVVLGIAESVGEEDRSVIADGWMVRIVEVLLSVIQRELVVVGKEGSPILEFDDVLSRSDEKDAKAQVDAALMERKAVLIGEQAVETFVLLGRAFCESAFPDLVSEPKSLLQMVTLRLLGVVEGGSFGIKPLVVRQPLTGTLTHIFERIKDSFSSSSLLSSATFTYIFPLLRAISLRSGRAAKSSGIIRPKALSELSIFASEVLFGHAALPSLTAGALTDALPVRNIVKSTLALQSNYPRLHKVARESLLTFAVALGDDADDEYEDDEDDEGEANGHAISPARKAAIVEVILELLDGLLQSEEAVRETCLAALGHLTHFIASDEGSDVTKSLNVRLWMCRHDEVAGIKEEAERVWSDWAEIVGIDGLSREEVLLLKNLAVHKNLAVRKSTASALRSALKSHPELTAEVVDNLYGVYREASAPPVPEYDEYGIVIPASLDKADEWEAREGVALVMSACAPVIDDHDTLKKLFRFFIEEEALADRSELVRDAMLNAGLSLIKAQGKHVAKDLFGVFDSYLERPAQASETHDRIRESVVILLGTSAQHLAATDSTIPQVVSKLVQTLKTPSEPVQIAVSDCLPPLIKIMKDAGGESGDRYAQDLVKELLCQLFTSPKYGERRGAAYGLAGVVKGRGISALKDYGIMQALKESVEDKKNVHKREGAMFAFETLSYSLGRLFEPYVIQILPLLLSSFGDPNKDVRDATQDACRVIMSKLSAHCVKLVLPSLLNGLEDKSWRAKTGSIEVLGSMAFLAPKQLSLSLPTIVPRLCEVLADSHAKVQEAAKTSLNNFGEVIKNPEIQALVPTLLGALVDPNSKTSGALSALLETAFVHYIDSPSLALVVPILQRGLKERSTDIKKKAAQIMGNMASLTDPKDLIPYMEVLLPGLKEVMVDPVPEARAIAAKALGSMVEKLGEDNFPGLLAELIATLKRDTSAVDRSGAAQGVSEVVAGLGLQRLEALLPEVLTNVKSPRPYVREGFMMLLIYLPATHGDKFTTYLGTIIPPVLSGLADESEPVRDAALRAGRIVVRNYATKAVDLLLPELEQGLFDDNWRIRLSSVQLMGDLLYRISGITKNPMAEFLPQQQSKGDDEDADNAAGDHGRSSLIEALGLQRYQQVLAALYMVRADATAMVRQSSITVWKSLVSNTPRTLKEIFSIMMSMVIGSLASPSNSKRGVAARTMGDLVRKLGEGILHEIVPILERGLESPDLDTRQGVCIGMSEIMATAGKQQITDFVTRCIPSVRTALVDPEPEVRSAAAQAFDMLHSHLGNGAVDAVLPSLLNDLKTQQDQGATGEANYALEALKEIMAVRSNVVFPVLIPTLIAKPITRFNARALGSLISVAGPALTRRLSTILSALLEAIVSQEEEIEDLQATMKVLLMSVGEDGLNTLMALLTDAVTEPVVARNVTPSTKDIWTYSRKRAAALTAVGVFFKETKIPFTDPNSMTGSGGLSTYVGDWINRLVVWLSAAGEPDTVKAAWEALDSVVGVIRKDELEKYVVPLRKAIRTSGERAGISGKSEIAGFLLPKGIGPVLPIFLQGLMYGHPDVREQAAIGLGDLVDYTSPDALKPFVTQITGPLIRIIGDRFPMGVKSGILQTLHRLLLKVPALLKPFLPQLQRTFIKSLSEPSKEAAVVREHAAKCLSVLITLQTRLDPLVVEISQGIKGTGSGAGASEGGNAGAVDRGVKEAMWEAMLGLLHGLGAGRDISDVSKKTIESLLGESLLQSGDGNDAIRLGAAKCFGAFCKYLSPEDSKRLINTYLLKPAHSHDVSISELHGISSAIFYIIEEDTLLINNVKLTADVVSVIRQCGAVDGKLAVAEKSVLACGILLSKPEYNSPESMEELEIVPFLIGLLDPSKLPEVRREVLIVLKNLAKTNYEVFAPHLRSFVGPAMVCVRDRIYPVKLAAERSLVYAFQLRDLPEGGTSKALQKYLETQDAVTSRTIGDYARRVLAKLAEKDSEAEDEE